MECRLLIFLTVILYLNFVASKPQDYRHEANHLARLANIQRVPQNKQNLNYNNYPSYNTDLNPSTEKWSGSQALPQHHKILNFRNSQFVSKIPQNSYQEILPESLHGGQSVLTQNNFATPQIVLRELQSYKGSLSQPTLTRPNDKNIFQSQQLPTLQSGNNLQSDNNQQGGWNGQRFPQQYNNNVKLQTGYNERRRDISLSDLRQDEQKIPQHISTIPSGNDVQSREWWNDQRLSQQYNNVAQPQTDYEKPRHEPSHLVPSEKKIFQYKPVSTLPYENNSPSKEWWNGQRLPQQYINDAQLQTGYEKSRDVSSDVVPNDKKIFQHKPISTLPPENNLPSEGWWNGQRLPQTYNDVAQPKNDYDKSRLESSDLVPNENKIFQHKPVSTLPPENNLPSKGWWDSQRPQQYKNVAQPQTGFDKLRPESSDIVPNDNKILRHKPVSTLPPENNFPSGELWNSQRLLQQYNKVAQTQTNYDQSRHESSDLVLNDKKKLQQKPAFTLTPENNLPSQGWWNGQRLPQQYNNNSKPQTVLNEPTNYEEIPPLASDAELPQYSQISAPVNRKNNIPSEKSWFGRNLSQQDNVSGKPQTLLNKPAIFEDIPSLANDAEVLYYSQISTPLSDQDVSSEKRWFGQRLLKDDPNEVLDSIYTPNPFVLKYPLENAKNHQEYAQDHALELTHAAPINSDPAGNTNKPRQGWTTPVQNQDRPAPASVDYLQWPSSVHHNLQTSTQDFETDLSSEYNRPAEPDYSVFDKSSDVQLDPIPFIIDPVNQNNNTQIVPSNQTVNDSSNSNYKHYIIVHANGTYIYVNNLDDIEVDEFNVARFKSKDGLQHIQYIVEVEYNIPETESEKPSEAPFDTGISKLPQDMNRDTNYQDNAPVPRNYSFVLLTDQIHDIQTTTEDHDIRKYFKQEYIMPIQSTTLKSIDSTTGIILSTTTTAKPTTEPNIQNTLQTTTDIPDLVQNVNNGDLTHADLGNICTEPSEEGTTPFDNDNQYYESETENNSKMTQSSASETTTNKQTTTNLNRDNYTTDITNSLPPATLPHDMTKDLENGTQEQTTSYPAGFGTVTTLPEDTTSDSPTTCKPDKLKADLEIDLSELSTIEKPVVWFKPDEKFWEKISQGKDPFNMVSFYDVRCEPRLIERETTVHHYPNGTEIIDFVETYWNHIGDEYPKEVNSNRLVKNPDA